MRTRFIFNLLAPVSAFVARQLAYPSGWFGRTVITRALNRGNRELIEASIDSLALTAQTRLLDVGFGGGLSLELARRRGVVQLYGIDPSTTAVEHLRVSCVKWIAGSELTLVQGSVENLPFEARLFDAIVSTNTVYFWHDLAAAFAELRRVTSPRGRLVLGFSGADKLREFSNITRHGFCLHDNEAILAEAQRAGFSNARLTALHGRDTEGDLLLVGSV